VGVIEQYGSMHVGETEEHAFSVRVLAATHRDMSERVRSKGEDTGVRERVAFL
jgi:transcriptional regulator with GAF, ATPase, and Fis domain